MHWALLFPNPRAGKFPSIPVASLGQDESSYAQVKTSTASPPRQIGINGGKRKTSAASVVYKAIPTKGHRTGVLGP
jgi:hypothetical protein